MDSNRPNKRNQHKRNKNRRSNRITQQIIQQLVRISCCWNCFQFGHTRHQCPHPRETRCSFCRSPRVQTIQCKCHGATNHRTRNLSKNESQPSIENLVVQQDFDATVLVPNTNENAYEEQMNILVMVENEREQENPECEEEYLQIDLETSSLDED